MVQEAVSQLVADEPDQHGPGYLVAAAYADDVVFFDLDDLGILGIHARHAGPQQYPKTPVGNPGDPQQAPHSAERLANQVLSRRVLSAPGTDVHPVVHAAGAAGTAAFELFFLVPFLVLAAPGTVRHGILHPAATAPVAARVHAEPLGGLERRFAEGAFVGKIEVAPGTEGELGGDSPATAGTFRPR